MIVLAKHKIAIIHIPKCAGTNLKQALYALNNENIEIIEGIKVIDGIKYDTAHLTNNILACKFPDLFEDIKKYKTYAIIRNPEERFFSAINQYSKTQLKKPIYRLSKKEKKDLEMHIINRINSDDNAIEMIHFKKQIEFIEYKESNLVQNIIRIESIGKLESYIEKILDCKIFENRHHKNETLAYKNKFIAEILIENKLIEYAKSKVKSKTIKGIAKKIFLKKNENSELTEDTLAFVKNFYKEDFNLWNNAE